MKDIRTQNQGVLVGFRWAYVFDVSQTDSKELLELSSRVSGKVGERMPRLLAFVAGQGISLQFEESHRLSQKTIGPVCMGRLAGFTKRFLP